MKTSTTSYLSFLLRTITFLSATFCTVECTQSQIWQPMPDYPSTERDDGTRFIIDNISYCGTGLTPWWTELGDFQAFNMDNDTWTTSTSIPTGKERQYACGFSSSTHGYIFGGYSNGNFLNDLWKYDPGSDTWSEQAPLPANGRSGSTFFTIADTAYIIGGRTSSLDAITEIWAYSMTNDTWTAKSNFPFDSLWRASGTSYNQNGYLIFGRSPANTYHKELYKYTPINDSWSQISQFPGMGRTYSSISPVLGKLIVLGGLDSLGASYNDMWQFDTLTGIWDELSPIPALERRGGIAFHSPTAIYYTTGIDLNNTRLTETWKNENPAELNELEEIGLHLYPNPADGILRINWSSSSTPTIVTIYDQYGKIVLNQTKHTFSSIDVSSLYSGIYLLELRGTKVLSRSKFVKR